MFSGTDHPAPPRQARSREKLSRILRATEELLAERVFERLTTADVAARAGVSVGMIYTRFRSKDDLLPALLVRHHEAVEGRLQALLDALEDGACLRDRLETLVRFSIDYHVKYRGLLRALAVYVKTHPEAIPAEMFEVRADQYRRVAAAVVQDGAEIRHERPDHAVQFILRALNSICREQLLFDDATLTSDLEEMPSDLVRMSMAYLTLTGDVS